MPDDHAPTNLGGSTSIAVPNPFAGFGSGLDTWLVSRSLTPAGIPKKVRETLCPALYWPAQVTLSFQSMNEPFGLLRQAQT